MTPSGKLNKTRRLTKPSLQQTPLYSSTPTMTAFLLPTSITSNIIRPNNISPRRKKLPSLSALSPMIRVDDANYRRFPLSSSSSTMPTFKPSICCSLQSPGNTTVPWILPPFGPIQQQQATDDHGPLVLTDHNPSSSTPSTTSQSTTTSSSAFTRLMQQYGPLAWNTYWGIYFGTLGGLFMGVQTGLVHPQAILTKKHHHHHELAVEKVAKARCSTSPPPHASTTSLAVFAASRMRSSKFKWLASYAPYVECHPMLANFVVAWLIAEAAEPLRIAATTVLVPVLARRRRSSARE